MTTAIIPTRATPSASREAEPITVSFNAGQASQVDKDYWNETDTLHRLLTFEVLRTSGACFALFPLRDGRRLNDNALPTSILALDFDSPNCPQMTSVMAYFQGCDYVAYTTRSHQINKKGVTCDRYRIVLALDKPIEPESMASIVHYFTDRWNGDASTFDGARFFFCGIETSDVYRNFGKPLSSDWLLSLGCQGKPQNAPGLRGNGSKAKRQTNPRVARQGAFDSNGNPIAYVQPSNYYVGKVKKAWDTLEKKNPNARHRDVYRLIVKLIQTHGNQTEQYRACLLEVQELKDFYVKNPHQWQGLDATIQDAWDYVKSLHTLDTPNPVFYLDPEEFGEREIVDVSAELARGIKGEGDFQAEAAIIDTALANHKRAIIDFGCGVGKTLVTTAYLSRDDYNGKTVIVKDTLRSARTQRDLLERMGIASDKITVIVGWEKNECLGNIERHSEGLLTKAEKDGLKGAKHQATGNNWQAFYNPQTAPCLNCCCCDSCDFNHSRTPPRIEAEIEKADYVIMSHSRFVTFFDWYKESPRDAMRVVIDEEPSVFETLVLSGDEIGTVLKTFNRVLKGRLQKHLHAILATQHKGTIKDTLSLSKADLKALRAVCKDLGAADKETCYKMINHYNGDCNRFAFVEDAEEGKKITFGRNRLNLDFENPCYILTASSPFSIVEWDGFSVIRNANIPDLNNVNVYAYLSNHTKTSMDACCMDYLKKVVGQLTLNGRQKVLLVINKEHRKIKETQKAIGWLTIMLAYHGIEFSVAYRGNVKGRNDWTDCDAVILVYGLFTSVGNVAIKASLTEGAEIEESRIWFEEKTNAKGQDFQKPKMHAGFCDIGLRNVDKRLICDELYQTAMRGRARMYRGESMDVFCVVPCPEYVTPLRQVMKDCTITTWLKDRVSTLTDIPKEELLKGDKDLSGKLGYPDTPEGRQQARMTAMELIQ